MSQEMFSQDVFLGSAPDVLGKGMTGAFDADKFNQNFVGICQVCAFMLHSRHGLRMSTAST